MKKKNLSGIITALVTPFDKNKMIDFFEFAKLIDFQLENGINKLLFFGTTGEGQTLTFEEEKTILKFAVDYIKGRKLAFIAPVKSTKKVLEGQISLFSDDKGHAKLFKTKTFESERSSKLNEKEEPIRQPNLKHEVIKNDVVIMAAISTNCTEEAKIRAEVFEEMGADCLLVTTPFFNERTAAGVEEHFKEISKASKLPIVLYDIPTRSGVELSVKSIVKLSKIKNIIGVKDASGSGTKIVQIKKGIADAGKNKNGINKKKPNFLVFSGNDNLTPALTLCGADGAISVLSNILPRETKAIFEGVRDGDLRHAMGLYEKLFDFVNLLFVQTNPAPIKFAMGLIGINCGEPRLPVVGLSKRNQKLIEDEFERVRV
jgi:4-hydroxy-tetrahydrodipicolinate synthase